jgi:hypothetical protein
MILLPRKRPMYYSLFGRFVENYHPYTTYPHFQEKAFRFFPIEIGVRFVLNREYYRHRDLI